MPTKINFDLRGNLRPYEKITIQPEEFKTIFVDNFSEKSNARKLIHETFLQFITDFQKLISSRITIWIDGSFVSNKMEPNDIDFVLLIDHLIFEEKEELIENQFRGKRSKEKYKQIDAYTVKFYPLNHEKRWVTDFDLVYWRNWFSETKKNRAKKKFPKGFIELQFGN